MSYSLARSPLRLPGSADIYSLIMSHTQEVGRSDASCGFLPCFKEAAYFRSLEKTDRGREDMSHYATDLKLFHGCGRSSLEFRIHPNFVFAKFSFEDQLSQLVILVCHVC